MTLDATTSTPDSADTNLHARPREPLAGAVWLPLTLLRPNPWNRKHFDTKALAELTESIRQHTVLQPVLARPIAGARNGQPLYEIVAGERRWRASQAADQVGIPALVREFTDFEVIRLVVIENIHREDLHPLDEAANYQALMRSTHSLQGYATVQELAAGVGKSESHIYQRLKLLDLAPEAAAALREGKLATSIAVAVARLASAADQATATAHLVQGWGGEPYTHKAALAYLQANYMLKLSQARFDLRDTFHAAGPCGLCSKRSGANPGLFPDEAQQADMCQDPPCFHAKTEEAHQRTLQAARDAGHKVLSGDAARAILPHPSAPPIGHHLLDKPCPALTASKKPLRELLGLNFHGTVVLDHPVTDTIITVAPDAKVRKALQSKGLLREDATPAPPPASPPEPPPRPKAAGSATTPAAAPSTPAAVPELATPAATRLLTPNEVHAYADDRHAQLFGPKVFRALHEALREPNAPLLPGLRVAAMFLHSGGPIESRRLLFATHGWPLPEGSMAQDDDLRQRILQADLPQLLQLMVEAVALDDLSNEQVLDDMETDCDGLAVASALGIDVNSLDSEAYDEARAEIEDRQAELRAQAGGGATTPAEALAKGSGNKAPAKYRCEATGSTWSGRGLKPKWLTVALEGGAKLSDFEVRP